MAFLDNSGDIILDAVLTDTGRMRLAKGDGSFRVAKFALGDDEIDYSLYNKQNLSGTAYFDLEILQTPILEAFSNNGASMKSKLISISRNNLLYLPVIKLDDITQGSKLSLATSLVNNGYILAADLDTENYINNGTGSTFNGANLKTQGTIFGSGLTTAGSSFIKVDQGQDTTELPASQVIDADLKETQYLIEIDNRFASIVSTDRTQNPSPSYIDDDNIATYYFSIGTDTKFGADITIPTNLTAVGNQVIKGPKGTYLQFSLKTQAELTTSDYLFNLLGKNLTTGAGGFSSPASVVRGILTNIRITGVTTGSKIDIPLMIIKLISP